MSQSEPLARAIARHLPADGTVATAIPGVTLIRASTPTLPMPVVYEPTVCFVAQGRKRALLGTAVYDYDPAHHLIASVGLPVVGAVTAASREAPYLSLQLDLDPRELAELALDHPGIPGGDVVAPPGLTLGITAPALLDAATRLVALLDTPADAAALAPLVRREIHYRLLAAPEGAALRQLAQADTRLSQIGRAIRWIRDHYRERCPVDQAAAVAALSRSAFHHHFKAVTGLSPLAFRTRLRLQEARRLMLSEAIEAASAGYRVGYESPSQFSRDYARLFGAPPAADAGRLRAAAAAG
ncbi:AraC family transcriptional regulator [Sphingomonas yunnanensis]|uniref:AraC family transcriptional regulator n=1 Tax=Sphingomonas yunnanensis TaxID=310400 RepID=UPI001CA63649|nr:AraC family transcriptional regulator [Sphingomonas yunnanensis]MBY9064093.1 AraC family transcriptional regulator [Sphingomonas yunnanensis]